MQKFGNILLNYCEPAITCLTGLKFCTCDYLDVVIEKTHDKPAITCPRGLEFNCPLVIWFHPFCRLTMVNSIGKFVTNAEQYSKLTVWASKLLQDDKIFNTEKNYFFLEFIYWQVYSESRTNWLLHGIPKPRQTTRIEVGRERTEGERRGSIWSEWDGVQIKKSCPKNSCPRTQPNQQ